MRTHLTLSILAAATLGGCAPMGTSTFDCNRLQDPSSPSCVSFRGAVAGTDGAVPMTRFDRELRLSEADRRTNIAPPDAITDKASLPESVEDDLRRQSLRATAAGDASRRASVPAIGSTGTVQSSAAAPLATTGRLLHQVDATVLAGRPVREAPVILKVVINRWVDDDDMLREGTTVYREIVPPRWAGFAPIARPGARRGSPYRAADVSDSTTQTPVTAAQPNQPGQPRAAANPNSSAQRQGAGLPQFVQPGSAADPAPQPAGPNGALPD